MTTERYYTRVKPYGFWNLMLDILLLAITGGLWIIIILIRELRRR